MGNFYRYSERSASNTLPQPTFLSFSIMYPFTYIIASITHESSNHACLLSSIMLESHVHSVCLSPCQIKLKLEKCYESCVLMTKKRYCGYMRESPSQDLQFEGKSICQNGPFWAAALALKQDKFLRFSSVCMTGGTTSLTIPKLKIWKKAL